MAGASSGSRSHDRSPASRAGVELASSSSSFDRAPSRMRPDRSVRLRVHRVGRGRGSALPARPCATRSRPHDRRRFRNRWSRRPGDDLVRHVFRPLNAPSASSSAPGLSCIRQPVDQRLGGRFSPTPRPRRPSRRNFSTAMSSAAGRDVPDMGVGHVDDHALERLAEVEGAMKSSTEAKNSCPSTGRCARGHPRQLGAHAEELRDLAGEEDARQQHARPARRWRGCGCRRRPPPSRASRWTDRGCSAAFLIDDQENVPIETMIMIATSAASG
jgi:hypothetical protein